MGNKKNAEDEGEVAIDQIGIFQSIEGFLRDLSF